jgi:hypothetical protein
MKRVGILVVLVLLACRHAAAAEESPDPRYAIGDVLFSDDFADLKNWSPEVEKGGKLSAHDGQMEIDVPGGCTAWFMPSLRGPVMIRYEARLISAGGTNDRVSDLNCFWMASDSRFPAAEMFAHPRSGKFSDYDRLLTYYVGLGGNTNTTSRFRRYIGRQDNRPLLPQNDLRDKADLLTANRWQTLRLVACGGLIQYWRDDKKLFEMNDPDPYKSGWFAVRTTWNHMAVRRLRIWSLTVPATWPSN